MDSPPPTISSAGISKYKAGFICSVHETLGAPFERVLKYSPGIENDTDVYEQCDINLTLFAQRRVGKSRPCVVLNSRNVVRSVNGHEPRMQTDVCLMGTFHNTPYELLPRICQHFVIPIRPNPRSTSEGHHMHATPEMSHENQYIIAIQMTTERFIKGTWPPAGQGEMPPEPVVHHIEYESMQRLRGLLIERMEEWERMCEADPEFAVRCAVEYRVRNISLRVLSL